MLVMVEMTETHKHITLRIRTVTGAALCINEASFFFVVPSLISFLSIAKSVPRGLLTIVMLFIAKIK